MTHIERKRLSQPQRRCRLRQYHLTRRARPFKFLTLVQRRNGLKTWICGGWNTKSPQKLFRTSETPSMTGEGKSAPRQPEMMWLDAQEGAGERV